MKKLLIVLMLLISLYSQAQTIFKGDFTNSELNLRLKINLYEQNITQLQFDDDFCYGYLQGSINGSWVILKVISLDDNKAEVRAVSDSGVEAQTLMLQAKDNTIEIRQIKDTNIRGIKNGKYTKLPKVMVFTRQ